MRRHTRQTRLRSALTEEDDPLVEWPAPQSPGLPGSTSGKAVTASRRVPYSPSNCATARLRWIGRGGTSRDPSNSYFLSYDGEGRTHSYGHTQKA